MPRGVDGSGGRSAGNGCQSRSLVSGGVGFLGSDLVDALCQPGDAEDAAMVAPILS